MLGYFSAVAQTFLPHPRLLGQWSTPDMAQRRVKKLPDPDQDLLEGSGANYWNVPSTVRCSRSHCWWYGLPYPLLGTSNECPGLALRRILKTWEKLLVWAAISRCSAWSFQNFSQSLRMAALRSRFSLRYSGKFPERRADRRWSIIFRVSLDIHVVHATDRVSSSAKCFQLDRAASARALNMLEMEHL